MITDNEILHYIGKQPKHTAGFKQLIHDLGIRGRDRRTVQTRCATWSGGKN